MMSSNCLLCPIDSDSHSLSASPALVTEFTVHYLQQPGSTLSARSTSLATQYIYGENAASAPL